MARPYNPALRLSLNPITTQLPSSRSNVRGITKFAVHAHLPAEDDAPTESLRRVQVTQSPRRSRRKGTGGGRQSVVSIGTAYGGSDEWSSDFDLTLRQLELDDLIEDGQRDAQVLVHLAIQQHARFGMSIKGRVVTSFGRICDSCSSSYCTKIDEHFDVTVLSSSRKDQHGLRDIGDTDPSVIYVKPGVGVDLDSVIQDTIRLTAAAKTSCSEACENSTVVWQYNDSPKKRYNQSWSKLLDLKKALDRNG